jgi:predicted secreted acid phosphatase
VKVPVVFCDLDSTLADTQHRAEWIEGPKSRGERIDWNAYSMQCTNDRLIEGTAALLRLLDELGVVIVLLSGRAEQARELTEKWLAKHDIPYADLLLREKAMREHQGKYKLGRIVDWQANHPDHEVVLHIDDWHEVSEKLASIQLPMLGVNPFYATELERQKDLDQLR